ncbi:unnamed protein product [Nesidiocoris tenuis]|uniref:Uncharacterized protein n=1 Tax=Nesidiocoris tenuis TaxID=355587 RepID=A0A6H5HDJ2_9HEMI|nr:unnamed protein product [Nesidiocoris tenuis]
MGKYELKDAWVVETPNLYLKTSKTQFYIRDLGVQELTTCRARRSNPIDFELGRSAAKLTSSSNRRHGLISAVGIPFFPHFRVSTFEGGSKEREAINNTAGPQWRFLWDIREIVFSVHEKVPKNVKMLRYCRISFDIVGHRSISSNIVRYHPISAVLVGYHLSDIVPYDPILPNMVQYCLTSCDIVPFCPIQSNSVPCCSILSVKGQYYSYFSVSSNAVKYCLAQHNMISCRLISSSIPDTVRYCPTWFHILRYDPILSTLSSYRPIQSNSVLCCLIFPILFVLLRHSPALSNTVIIKYDRVQYCLLFLDTVRHTPILSTTARYGPMLPGIA